MKSFTQQTQDKRKQRCVRGLPIKAMFFVAEEEKV